LQQAAVFASGPYKKISVVLVVKEKFFLTQSIEFITEEILTRGFLTIGNVIEKRGINKSCLKI